MTAPVAGALFAGLACVFLVLQAKLPPDHPWRPWLTWPYVASSWAAIAVFMVWVMGEGHGGVSLDELVPWLPMIAGLVSFWTAFAILRIKRH